MCAAMEVVASALAHSGFIHSIKRGSDKLAGSATASRVPVWQLDQVYLLHNPGYIMTGFPFTIDVLPVNIASTSYG